jgi:hypothetical protein
MTNRSKRFELRAMVPGLISTYGLSTFAGPVACKPWLTTLARLLASFYEDCQSGFGFRYPLSIRVEGYVPVSGRKHENIKSDKFYRNYTPDIFVIATKRTILGLTDCAFLRKKSAARLEITQSRIRP